MFVEAEAESPRAVRQARLVEELATQAAHVEAGVCRLLELVAECEQHVDWGDNGMTFATWLAWRCSLSQRQAREYERVAKRLPELPLTHGAFSRGELSLAKTSALMRFVEPETEGELLHLAEALTVSQLERSAGVYRALRAEEAATQQKREFLQCRWDEDGSLAMRARLAAEDGALVLRALEAGRDAAWERSTVEAPDDEGHAPGASDDGMPRRPTDAEALVAMADLALGSATAERQGAERYQVVVHVDAEALAGRAGGRCELADGEPLAAETARRISCDASVVELLERDGEPLSLGRKRRTLSQPLRRALRSRDRGCRFPGCRRTRFVDGHHIEHWSRGGATNLDNLVSLCRRHHRLVHERGFSVRLDEAGEVHFTNEYGIAIVNAPRPPSSSPGRLRDLNRRAGLAIDSKTGRCGPRDRMDLGCLAAGLTSIVRRAGP